MRYTVNLRTESTNSFNEGLSWLDPSSLRRVLINAKVIAEILKYKYKHIPSKSGPNCLIYYEVPKFLINRTCFVPKTQISEAKDIINFCSTFGGRRVEKSSPHPLKSFYIGDTFPSVVKAKGYYSYSYSSYHDLTSLAVDKFLKLHTPAGTEEGIFYLGDFFQ